MFGQSKTSKAIVKRCATLNASLLLITVLTFLAEKMVFLETSIISVFSILKLNIASLTISERVNVLCVAIGRLVKCVTSTIAH